MGPAGHSEVDSAALVDVTQIRRRRLIWRRTAEGSNADDPNPDIPHFVDLDPGQLGAAYFIGVVLVPLLLITHGLVFRLLYAPRLVESRRKRGSAPVWTPPSPRCCPGSRR